MRNLKKFLALVLAMMMAMSLMITANAANEADNATKVYPDGDSVTEAFVEAVDVLSGMKVFKGRPDGKFDAGATITRAETAAIIYRLMTADVEDTQAELFRNVTHPFTDVKPADWYAGYIGFLWNAGIIKGQTATTFNPYGQVTGYEALAMILRAVGYDQNHEFEGTNWVVNVASIAQRKGILKDVESANYGGPYLYSAARRDVVASLLFRTAAYVPQVIYTNAFQYTESGMSGGPIADTTINQSLGEQNFGLICAHGVVVGNQATGESVTKIGFCVAPNLIAGANGTDRTMSTIDEGSYYYVGGQTVGTKKNSVESFNWNTDLRLFNHAVRVWYDYRGGVHTTYAVYDKATNVAVVHASDANLTTDQADPANNGDLYTKATESEDWQADVDNNWKAPGFTVNSVTTYKLQTTDDATADPVVWADAVKGGDGLYTAADLAKVHRWVADTNNAKAAFFNYNFTRMGGDNKIIDGGAAASAGVSALSPIAKNDHEADGDPANEWGLYLLISNSPNKNLDVVIPLDLTFSQIRQQNKTTGRESVGVLNGNGASGGAVGTASDNAYFDTFDSVPASAAAGNTADYASIAVKNLVCDSPTTLGTRVAAIQITGTDGSNAAYRAAVAAGEVDFGFAAKNAGMRTAGVGSVTSTTQSTYYYQLVANSLKKTDTVIKITTSGSGLQDVYLADGTVLHQSVYAEATDANFTTDIEGVDDAAATITTRLIAGREYTFTLDEQGHYIYWDVAANDVSFVYGTYLDWQTAVASSLFDYPMVYVNGAGEGKQQVNVLSIDGDPMDIEEYDDNLMPKRDAAGATGGNNSGFVRGRYTGYIMGPDGVLSTNLAQLNYQQASATNFGKDTAGAKEGITTIDSTSLRIGAQGVGDLDNLFLTENTKFVIVNGAGTANQTVTVRNGISDLLKGMDSVTINGVDDIPYTDNAFLSEKARPFAGTDIDDPYEMIYFQTGPFTYDQSYAPSALEIKTIFIPEACVSFQGGNNMVFVGDNTAKAVNSNNGQFASLFTVYRDGKGEDVWIDGNYTNGTASATNSIDAHTVANVSKNMFYNLYDTGRKATDGNVIYGIRLVNDNAPIMGMYFNGTKMATGDTGTDSINVKNSAANGVAWAAATDTPLMYKATTFSEQVGYIGLAAQFTPTISAQLYNVGGAGIKNLNSTYSIPDNDLNALNGASSLTTNVGVPVSCIVSTADSLVVTQVYVNAN